MTARAASHIREAELPPVAFSSAFLEEPLTVALMDSAGWALSRWSPARFWRQARAGVPLALRGPTEFRVLRDYLLENAPSDAVAHELEVMCQGHPLIDLARQVLRVSGYGIRENFKSFRLQKPKKRRCLTGVSVWAVLVQVHLHGRAYRMAVDEGDTERAKQLRADRRTWVRRALDLRNVHQLIRWQQREATAEIEATTRRTRRVRRAR